MKRIIALICVFVLLFSLCSCAQGSKETDSVEQYRAHAQKRLDKGDVEGAVTILEKAVAYTGDDGLQRMLDASRKLLEKQKGAAGSVADSESDLHLSSASETAALPQETAAPTETNAPTETPAPTETAAPMETAAPTETAKPTQTDAPKEPAEPVPSSSSKNLLDGFDSGKIKSLNVFLSNFSEAFMGSYDNSNYRYFNVLDYCFIHIIINNSDYISYTQREMRISADKIDTAAKRYLGAVVPRSGWYENDSTAPYRYENGYWYTVAASGESYNYFSIANKMTKNNDGTYDVSFDVYALDLETYWRVGMPSDLYSVRSASKSSYPIEYCYSGTAVVRDYTLSSGAASYQLIRYNTD